ncbi:putative PH-like domain superfamily, NECAP, PHear domain-containing protein [Helianthus annuus]|nr:putative PH-like domain superfamily, NECAP, PHear domain-containing protein [Helianthus annuus]KAJ0799277.1 putative PH-like domain superfamily, NECAP, PHear domain-containing protein [Helianthus annuus]KAJ0954102.1 putative PH-like domain superfamily, NECAP, PHear domain-containing protein [Helianthus annuus]
MSFELEEEEDSFEHTLLVVREVSVFKIPPRSTSGGYKCGEWLQSDKIWSGRLRVISCNNRCEIRLEDPNSGDLFAACFVNPGQRETAVEPVLDSSRYFVLKIEDGTGKHAFVGLGFTERNEAFDFNVALSDHEKYVKRESEKDDSGASDESCINIHPAVNHRLKEGETIRITVKNKPTSGAGMLSTAGVSGGGSSGTEKVKPLSLAPPPAKTRPSGADKVKPLSLAPPPATTGKIRSLIPPPPNDPAAVRMTAANHKETSRNSTDAFSDLSQLERDLPSKSGSGSSQSKTTAAGWAAF